jgi:outer membrane protein assembly factor BamB
MQKVKAVVAIFVSLTFGVALSTFTPGCQPRGKQPSSLVTDSSKGSLVTEGQRQPSDKKLDEADARQADVVPENGSDKGTDDKPVKEKPADEPAAEGKPEEQKSTTSDGNEKPAAPSEAKPAAEPTPEGDSAAVAPVKAGDWPQWGGNGLRNNVPAVENAPVSWNPGQFDRKTSQWISDKTHSNNKWIGDKAQNIKWVATLGSQTYGNPVVANGKLVVGTNNASGYVKRYPGSVDLGVLLCFNEADGSFLWQHSSEKLPTGRVHDWPMLGICSSALIEGDKVWFVTSRGEVRCLDLDGFHDGTDDGRPEKQEPAKMFETSPNEDPEVVAAMVAGLEEGKLTDEVRSRFAAAGMELPADVAVKADPAGKGPVKKWTAQVKVGDATREISLTHVGPRLTGYKIITPDDKEEADVVWVYNMMTNLGTSQHNMCSCSVTALGDILFVNTGNGLDEQHTTAPNPNAPSFLAMDKNTGEVHWHDNSPGINILHGQWSSPAVAVIQGVPQVIFGAGDGWIYSFKADKGKDGKPELLWKFDSNLKTSVLELGGRGTKNDIIGTPVVYKDRVYFATGQDPEHGEGIGILWCVDATKRGDVSESIVVNRADPEKPIPHKRLQSCVEAEGDIEKPNPNSAVVWKYMQQDNNGDGEIDDFMETFHRSIASVAIKNDILVCPDFSGLVHCLDANTGKAFWTYDMLAASWGSPLIAGDHVYVGDEDGDISIFKLSADPKEAMKEDSKGELVPINANDKGDVVNMLSSVYSTPIIANGLLYIGNKDHVFAIEAGADEKPAAGGGN